MNIANKIINFSNISIGNIENVNVKMAEIFKVALLSNASKIIIAHNHPSGVLEVTEKDIFMTKNIGAVAVLFNIQLIDSLIVYGDKEAISVREYISKGKC